MYGRIVERSTLLEVISILPPGRERSKASLRMETAVGLEKIITFLLEDELISLGVICSKVNDWCVYTVVDRRPEPGPLS